MHFFSSKILMSSVYDLLVYSKPYGACTVAELRGSLRRQYCTDLDLGRRTGATQVANLTVFPSPWLPELGQTDLGFPNPDKDRIPSLISKAL